MLALEEEEVCAQMCKGIKSDCMPDRGVSALVLIQSPGALYPLGGTVSSLHLWEFTLIRVKRG